MRYILFYEYAPDCPEREPLALAQAFIDRFECQMDGKRSQYAADH